MYCFQCSGVFSTGAVAPAILRKRLIASAILHLPYSVQGTDSNTESFRSLKFDVTFSCVFLYPNSFFEKNFSAKRIASNIFLHVFLPALLNLVQSLGSIEIFFYVGRCKVRIIFLMVLTFTYSRLPYFLI